VRIEAWWTANRLAAPDLFQRELETTVAGSLAAGQSSRVRSAQTSIGVDSSD